MDIPVIASGGVGTLGHLVDGVTEGGADAVLAASIFHFGEHTVGEAKAALGRRRPVRPPLKLGPLRSATGQPVVSPSICEVSPATRDGEAADVVGDLAGRGRHSEVVDPVGGIVTRHEVVGAQTSSGRRPRSAAGGGAELVVLGHQQQLGPGIAGAAISAGRHDPQRRRHRHPARGGRGHRRPRLTSAPNDQPQRKTGLGPRRPRSGRGQGGGHVEALGPALVVARRSSRPRPGS